MVQRAGPLHMLYSPPYFTPSQEQPLSTKPGVPLNTARYGKYINNTQTEYNEAEVEGRIRQEKKTRREIVKTMKGNKILREESNISLLSIEKNMY